MRLNWNLPFLKRIDHNTVFVFFLFSSLSITLFFFFFFFVAFFNLGLEPYIFFITLVKVLEFSDGWDWKLRLVGIHALNIYIILQKFNVKTFLSHCNTLKHKDLLLQRCKVVPLCDLFEVHIKFESRFCQNCSACQVEKFYIFLIK